MRARTRRVEHHLLGALGVAALLGLWSLLAWSDTTEAQIVPRPLATMRTLGGLLVDQAFWGDFLATWRRMLLGFAASISLSLPLGLGLGLSRRFESFVGGVVDGFRYTPVVAFIPLLVLFLGIGDRQKVAVLMLGTVPYLTVMVADAVRSVRKEHVHGALTLGVGGVGLVRHVMLPSVAPQLLDAVRITLGISWTYLLTAELIGSNEGLGRYVIRAQRFLHTERLLAAVVIIGCIGWLSDLVLRRAHRRLFPWFRIATGNDR